MDNAQIMCKVFSEHGLNVQTEGTDSHIILLNFSQYKYSGKQAADELEKYGIIVNKNPVPNDPRSLRECSGIRIGTAAETTKGTANFPDLAREICRILDGLQ